MPQLAAVAPYLMAGSAVMQMAGTIGQGNAARATANNQAAQLEQQAGQSRATAQREAEAKRRQGEFASSRAQAVQAAAGGNPDSFTAVENEKDLVGQGEYGALTAMFNGEERARGMEYNAANKRLEGKAAHDAGVTSAIASGLSSAGKIAGMTTGGSGETMTSKYTDPFNNNGGSFDSDEYGPYQSFPWQQ